MQQDRRDLLPKDRSTAFLIFGFLLACAMVTYTGRIDSSDGLSTFATAENWVRRGALDNNQLLWMGNQQGNIGPDGNLYTRKGLGMVLLAAPLVWVASVWPQIGLVHAALLLNPLLTAWTGALLFRTGRRLGWSRAASIGGALLFGLFTMAWPYTQTFFSDPVSGWGLLAAAYGLLAYGQSGRKLYLLGAGLAWAIAYLTRTLTLVTLPLYAVGLWLVLPPVGQTGPGLEWLRQRFWGYWRPVVAVALPVVGAGLLSLWWNWVRFGDVWDTGYVETERFSGDWLFGLYGLTVGPARGVLWYNPALWLALPGAFWFWRHQRRLLLPLLALVALYFGIYAKWYMWHGGYSWGPRFVVPTVPFLCLLALPGWRWLFDRGWGGKAAGVLLLLLSLAVQLLGLLVPYGLVQERLAEWVQPLFAAVTFTEWRYSPLLLQGSLVNAATVQLAWWRGAADWAVADWAVVDWAVVDWLALGGGTAGLLAGGLLLAQQLRSVDADDTDDRLRNWLYGSALAVLTVGLLTHYATALADPTLQQVAERIRSAEQPEDAILLLQPEQTQAFANLYRGRLPVYGEFELPAQAGAQPALLERLRSTYTRLWVVPGGLAAEASGWERPLRTQDFLLAEDRVAGEAVQRLALYALQPAAALVENGLGALWGDPARLPVDENNGWIRLRGYALTPAAEPGGHILLTLHWQSLRTVERDYQVFVHLLDAGGNKVAQRDGQPVQWMRPTRSWRPGEEIVDRYGILLPETLGAGEYRLAVGLYDPATGQRLAVSAGPASFAIELGPVRVKE